MLKDIPHFIPKGVQREELRKVGKVKDPPFIEKGELKIRDFRFLKRSRDNTLKSHEAQARDLQVSAVRISMSSCHPQLEDHPSTSRGIRTIPVEDRPGTNTNPVEDRCTNPVEDRPGTCHNPVEDPVFSILVPIQVPAPVPILRIVQVQAPVPFS